MPFSPSKIVALVGLFAPLAGFAQNAKLLNTLTNPAPDGDGYFGRTVAALGTDRVLVGAPFTYAGEASVGAAFLLSTNGTLLTTFTNPVPQSDAEFGHSLAVVGTDHVILGAPGHDTYAGAAYLFRTDGTLVTTFTGPSLLSYDSFGIAVAALGNDRVLIGASAGDAQVPHRGAAYLFNTNGTLLSTLLPPPTQELFDFFGFSVAAVGNDRLLVGAPWAGEDGRAYLYTTNGTLLKTFLPYQPSPNEDSDAFGWSVAAFGTDRVLIGSPYYNGAGGAAQLFSIDGSWLASFYPVSGSYFGLSVAALDDDGVLVSTGTPQASSAFLFSTNGTLRAAFCPSPADDFGYASSVAALGGDRVLLGTGAEKAYVFSTETEPPSLSVRINTNAPLPEWQGLGHSVAMLGNDFVVAGAPFIDANATHAGEAYLFSVHGPLVTAFTNPTPAANENFGWSVAAVGNDRVLIGPLTAKAVYLFSTNGSLLTTIDNPDQASSGHFGSAVAAVGSDRVFIGESSQKAHLFNTSGTWLLTLSNPAPVDATATVYDEFGSAVAVLSNDRLLVGGAFEKAHLFSTNGTLLTTFTNPTPTSSQFGSAVAALGSDRVLIGAYGDDTSGTNAGAVYLFRTNGTLLATCYNPAPQEHDRFGYSVTAVGSDQILIGAPYDNTGVPLSGAAYLFSTNGALLKTFGNPDPAPGDWFGWSVAAGDYRVLIGAEQDRHGFGSAYLVGADGVWLNTLALPPPPNPPKVIVSWSRIADRAGFVLEHTPTLGSPPETTAWLQVPTANYQTNGSSLFLQLSGPADQRFYRLRQP